MVALRARLFRTPAAWLALVLLAFGLRAVVPHGFMLEQRDDLSLTVSICRDAGVGPATITLNIPREPSAPDHTREADKPCAFGALGQAALLPPAAVLPAMLAFVMALALLPAPRIVLQRLARLRPPLRGPPIAT